MPVMLPRLVIWGRRVLSAKACSSEICMLLIVFLYRRNRGLSAIFSFRGTGNCFCPGAIRQKQVQANSMQKKLWIRKQDHRRKDPVTRKKGCFMYKIRFFSMNNHNSQPDWQFWTDAMGCPNVVTNLHHKYPEKAGPDPIFVTTVGGASILNMCWSLAQL